MPIWRQNNLIGWWANSHWLNMQFQVQNWWKEPKIEAKNQQSIQAKNSVRKEQLASLVKKSIQSSEVSKLGEWG